jgi:hypothetical protein
LIAGLAKRVRAHRVSAAASLALGLAASGLALAAMTIPAGTQLHAVLSSPDINTKNAQVGGTFTMQVVAPYPNGDATLASATIYGHVAQVTPAGQGRKAQLQLAFDSIRLPNGESAPISGTVVSAQMKSENTTARKALGAGVGMAVGSQTIGRIVGGAAGGVLGILGGAAAGFLYANNDKANFNIATGAAVVLKTTQSARVRVQGHL